MEKEMQKSNSGSMSEPSQQAIEENNIVVVPKIPVNSEDDQIEIASDEAERYIEVAELDVWGQERQVVVIPKERLEPVCLEVTPEMLAQYKAAIETDVWNDEAPGVVVFAKNTHELDLVVPKSEARKYEKTRENDVWEQDIVEKQEIEHKPVSKPTKKPKSVSPARERYNEILRRSGVQRPVRRAELPSYFVVAEKSQKISDKSLPPILARKEVEVIQNGGIDFIKRYNQALMAYEEVEITDDNKATERAKRRTESVLTTDCEVRNRSPLVHRSVSQQSKGDYQFVAVSKLVKEIIQQKPQPITKVDKFVGDL